MKTKQITYSKQFADFYDTYAQPDSPRVTKLVNSLLDTYNPLGVHLLELGCGTGMILEALPKRYTFCGLDISKHMIAVAKKKFPKTTFVVESMSTFRLKKQFDAIICFSDSINHLSSFSEWEKTFQHVYQHLKIGGVFIFDMNTPIRLERLSRMPRYISPLLDNCFFTVKVSLVKKSLYSFTIQIFNIDKNSVVTNEDIIEESTFPVEKVKKSLEKKFTIQKMIDVIRPRVSKKTGKVVFVCKKK